MVVGRAGLLVHRDDVGERAAGVDADPHPARSHAGTLAVSYQPVGERARVLRPRHGHADHVGQRLGRAGAAEVPALPEVDAELAQGRRVLRRLDALGDDRGVAAVAEVDERADERPAAPGRRQTPSTMLRSSLRTSGAVSTMCRSEEKPAPTSSMASRIPRGAQAAPARCVSAS